MRRVKRATQTGHSQDKDTEGDVAADLIPSILQNPKKCCIILDRYQNHTLIGVSLNEGIHFRIDLVLARRLLLS